MFEAKTVSIGMTCTTSYLQDLLALGILGLVLLAADTPPYRMVQRTEKEVAATQLLMVPSLMPRNVFVQSGASNKSNNKLQAQVHLSSQGATIQSISFPKLMKHQCHCR